MNRKSICVVGLACGPLDVWMRPTIDPALNVWIRPIIDSLKKLFLEYSFCASSIFSVKKRTSELVKTFFLLFTDSFSRDKTIFCYSGGLRPSQYFSLQCGPFNKKFGHPWSSSTSTDSADSFMIDFVTSRHFRNTYVLTLSKCPDQAGQNSSSFLYHDQIVMS